MTDVTIIGAGPAGSASAIHLARAGLRVALYDKARFPRAKLCGGFISGEALTDLEALDVLKPLVKAGAWPVHRVVIGSQDGRQASAQLGTSALSVSRTVLDHLLIQEAGRAGVQVHDGEDGMPHRKQSGWMVMATGRQCRARVRAQSYYGVQAVFRNVIGITDQVELNMISGGYVGMNRLTMRDVNVCALIHQSFLQRHGPNLDALLRVSLSLNPSLRQHLAGAERARAWKSVGPVIMGMRRLTSDRTIFVGDAACVVDPFVGEGIAMGLQSARLAANAMARSDHAAEDYVETWHRAFDAPLQLQRLTRKLVESPRWHGAVLTSLRKFPTALSWLTEHTRPRPLAVS